jgi:hypothetical protein
MFQEQVNQQDTPCPGTSSVSLVMEAQSVFQPLQQNDLSDGRINLTECRWQSVYLIRGVVCSFGNFIAFFCLF